MFSKLRSESGSLFGGGNKPKILVIEDNEVDRKIIEKALGSKYDPISADNAEDGLKLAREVSPNLILLDMNLPGMDGMEMCRVLKNTEGVENIPVIFLTAEDKPNMMVEAFQNDAENYLTKPINPKILNDQVSDILEEQS